MPYRLEIQSLDNPYAIRDALSDVAQALTAGQLDARVAGKLLYAIQLAASTNRRIDKMEAEAAKHQSNSDDAGCPIQGREATLSGGFRVGSQDADAAVSRLQEFPDLEEKLGLPPDADLDVVVGAVERKADEEVAARRADALPEPPPGVRPGSPAYRVFRDETYQMMRYQINDLRHQLREYQEQKNQKLKAEIELMKKEAMSATPAPERRADTAQLCGATNAKNESGVELRDECNRVRIVRRMRAPEARNNLAQHGAPRSGAECWVECKHLRSAGGAAALNAAKSICRPFRTRPRDAGHCGRLVTGVSYLWRCTACRD